MHEMSITQDMLAIVLEHAEQNQAVKVGKINLVVGELTGYVEDSVRFYFDFLSKDTIARDAVLEFTTVTARGKCRKCSTIFNITESDWTCSSCRSKELDIIEGKDLFVESIEIK